MKTLLVDDHALVLEGLKSILNAKGIEVVGTARNGAEALLQYEMYEPDLVLMDIQMAGCDGIQTTRLIKKEYPAAKIVMLTAFEDEDNLMAAIKAGASGYLLKDMEAESFIRQLTGIAAGEMPLAPRLAERLLHELSCHKQAEQASVSNGGLTDKQIKLVQLLTRGLTYREIAAQLELKESTIKYHVKEILSKLGLPNRTQLIAYALREGFIG